MIFPGIRTPSSPTSHSLLPPPSLEVIIIHNNLLLLSPALSVKSMTSSTLNLFFGNFSRPCSLESDISYLRPTKHSRRLRILLQFKKNLQTTRRLAVGKEAEDQFISNMTEDTDAMFNDLFSKYGKVVYKSNDQKPPTAEADDDSESLSFTVSMAKVASDTKAADIKVLFVKPLVYWTRFFIIATAFSRPQIEAIGTKIRDLAKKKYGKVASGDTKPNSWTLLDFGDVVIHIFLPEQRALYNLEEFYGNATPVELPFENQPPFRP